MVVTQDQAKALAELRNVGAQLANVAFNWAQKCGHTLTSDDCAMLDKLRKQWDAALSQPTAAQPLTDVKAAVLAERARCKRIVQYNQYRNGHHTHEGTKMGHFNIRMIDEIEGGGVAGPQGTASQEVE